MCEHPYTFPSAEVLDGSFAQYCIYVFFLERQPHFNKTKNIQRLLANYCYLLHVQQYLREAGSLCTLVSSSLWFSGPNLGGKCRGANSCQLCYFWDIFDPKRSKNHFFGTKTKRKRNVKKKWLACECGSKARLCLKDLSHNVAFQQTKRWNAPSLLTQRAIFAKTA